MKPRHQRIALIGGLLSAVGIIVALVLNAFQSNLVFFYSPTRKVRAVGASLAATWVGE